MFRKGNDAILEGMKYSDRFLGFCFVDAAAGNDAVAEIDRCIIEHKMRGIKLYHQRKAQDPVQAPVMQRAAELGVPVLLHAGRFLDPQAMIREPDSSHAGDFLEAMKRYPDTIFMQGHIGGGGDWQWNLRTLEKLESDNYYIDLSGSVVDHTIIRATVDTVGADRVLFATDGWFEEAIGKLQAARLSKKEEKMICSGNFEKLMQRRKGPAKNV
jgi:predicted TIM-barrel fold metal-dependent hydrolase